MGYIIPMREAWGIIFLTYKRGKREVRRAVCPEQAIYAGGSFLSSAAFGGKRRGYVCAYVRVRGGCGSLFSVDIVWAARIYGRKLWFSPREKDRMCRHGRSPVNGGRRGCMRGVRCSKKRRLVWYGILRERGYLWRGT